MSGTTIVVAGPDPARFRTACNLAAVQSALAGAVRLFLDAAAVPLLAEPLPAEATAALDLGCRLVACQTGLAEAGIDATSLDPRIGAGGMTELLATLGDDRLLVV